MTEPRTAAGRALLEREDLNERSFPLITLDAIRAIEAEAAAGVHLGDEELREAAQALVDWYDGPPYIYVEHEMEERIDAIRAALAAQEDPTSVQPPICKAKHTHCWEHRAASRRLAQEGETST